MSGSAQQGQQRDQAGAPGDAARRTTDQQQQQQHPSSKPTGAVAAQHAGVAGAATDAAADKWQAITKEDNSKEWQQEMSRIRQQWPGFCQQYEAKLSGVLVGVGPASADRRRYVVRAPKQQKQVFSTVRSLQQHFTQQHDVVQQCSVPVFPTLRPVSSNQQVPSPSHPNNLRQQSSNATVRRTQVDACGRQLALPASGVAVQRLDTSGMPAYSQNPAPRVVEQQHVRQRMPHSASVPQHVLAAGDDPSDVAAGASTGPPLHHSASATTASGGAPALFVDVRPGDNGWQGMMDAIRKKWPEFSVVIKAVWERLCWESIFPCVE